MEFAASSGLLILFLSGVWQFGYAFYIYNQLQSAVRGAARYGSVTAYDGGAPAGADFEARVKNMVVYGTPEPAANDRPLVPGLTPGHVRVNEILEGAVPREIVVDIVDYRIDSPFVRLSLNGRPRCTLHFLGRFVAPV